MIGCEYCHKNGGEHDFHCPLYVIPKSNFICSECKYPILNGDDYIENENGDLAHWECIKDTRHLLRWFGYRVKIMEDTKDEEFY